MFFFVVSVCELLAQQSSVPIRRVRGGEARVRGGARRRVAVREAGEGEWREHAVHQKRARRTGLYLTIPHDAMLVYSRMPLQSD